MVTSTVVEAAPGFSVTFSVIGTVERTSASCGDRGEAGGRDGQVVGVQRQIGELVMACAVGRGLAVVAADGVWMETRRRE